MTETNNLVRKQLAYSYNDDGSLFGVKFIKSPYDEGDEGRKYDYYHADTVDEREKDQIDGFRLWQTDSLINEIKQDELIEDMLLLLNNVYNTGELIDNNSVLNNAIGRCVRRVEKFVSEKKDLEATILDSIGEL